MKITVWNENLHEQKDPRVTANYPGGIHGFIASILAEDGHECRTATLDMPEHGLTDEVLADTDVLLWWGHIGHRLVDDAIVEKVYNRVQEGMGLIVLHSGHHSKIFKKLMGSTCNLKWRHDARERIWVVKPSHPIAAGVEDGFLLECEEMYGEAFDIPNPEDVIFMGWFNGGEVFRSGCTWTRGNGKIFYFQPGHETNTAYHNENVKKILKNAVNWARPTVSGAIPTQKFAALEE